MVECSDELGVTLDKKMYDGDCVQRFQLKGTVLVTPNTMEGTGVSPFHDITAPLRSEHDRVELKCCAAISLLG